MKEEFTRRQMELWGNTNMVIGASAITAVHFIVLLLGMPPLDWVWQGVLFVVLGLVGSLYYRQYKQTKETEGVVVDSSKTFEQAHSEAVDKVKEE